jgi:hypothetical protein
MGDKEGEGYAERYTSFDEADKERHGRTGTKRCYDAKERGKYITDKLPFMG